ncbi:hypothetical protein SlGVgp113 [Spodoptera litura granulovirus]|uniref:Uncharacterized protein n=1 Tax=Spodoptera litura granulovirus TaxID=359919 RepID=A5IZW5_9BBAC|nr:hypothetical protein SlGVgp113 [Spodoptera litura granulovirus]ABQ52056.1 hypothetical protein SlGVgp113 [Spodoptera litura granulovirus]
MYLKLFLLLFCATCGCVEVKNDRVKNLITTLQNIPLSRPDHPSYLNNIQQFQEASTSSTETPDLARHHLVSGSQLNLVYQIVLKNYPEAFIEMIRTIYINLPDAWRYENPDYLEAIRCLDDTVADEDVINVNCEEKVKMLHRLFYWRPDNIQVGPRMRFRDGGDEYDYDCFYLLRGAEMVYNIEFRTAIEDVIDAEFATIENVNQLLSASHRMITNRNVARNYNSSEWILLDINDCFHNRQFRNSLNVLEKTFDLKQHEFQTVDRVQLAITRQSMKRLIKWNEMVLQTYNYSKKNRLQKLADQIKKEKIKEKFTELMLDFTKMSKVQLDIKEFMDIILLNSGSNIITTSMNAGFWLKLYEHYTSDKPTITEEDIKEELNIRRTNKIYSTLNILRGNKKKSNTPKGYISSVENVIKYNTYFIYRYLKKNDLTRDELFSLANSIDTNNVTSTVKDFKEMRKKEDDDDDEERQEKTLSNWYTLLMGVYRLYEYKLCSPHFGESVQNIIQCTKKICANDDDLNTGALLDIMDKTNAIDNISPNILECSATRPIPSRISRVERDVNQQSLQTKQLQLRQLVEEVYNNIDSTYPYDRATVLYQMVANRMHPLIKQSLNKVCHLPENERVDTSCKGYRYPGCYWDQPTLEKAIIVMDKIACHSINILSFGIGYFYVKC